jgi:hypothetical protein
LLIFLIPGRLTPQTGIELVAGHEMSRAFVIAGAASVITSREAAVETKRRERGIRKIIVYIFVRFLAMNLLIVT